MIGSRYLDTLEYLGVSKSEISELSEQKQYIFSSLPRKQFLKPLHLVLLILLLQRGCSIGRPLVTTTLE